MVRVKKVNKVEIIRLERKTYVPERKPSIRRLLRRFRFLFPCRAEEITADQLEQLILGTFGTDYEYHVLISDEKFRVISREQMEQLLKEDDTDTMPYLEETSDCDDFSDLLLGQLTRKTWTQGYAIGQLWYINEEKNFGHAVNLFCDGKEILIIEPQNDTIHKWGEGDYSGKAFMVKF